jgi:hypothetical protein
LWIGVKSTFSSDTKADRSASLLIGTKTTDTYDDDEAFIGEDTSNPQWKWDLANLDTASPTIGVYFAADLDKDEGEDYEDYDSVIYPGEAINFPWDFASISFDSLTQTDSSKYTFDTDTRDLYDSDGTTLLATSREVLRVISDQSNSGLLVGTQKTDTVYIAPSVYGANDSVDVFYKSSSNSRAVTGLANSTSALFTIDYSKTTQAVTMVGFSKTTPAGNLSFSIGTTGTETLLMAITPTATTIDYLGLNNADTDSGLWYGTSSIAGLEEDLVLTHGVKIGDPDSDFQKSDGELELWFPGDIDDFRANIVVAGGTGVTTTTESDTGTYSINTIGVGLGMLDRNAEGLLGSSTPLIVVGGPCANTVAMELMGNPVDCAEGFEQGKAKIKLYTTQNAILVAGYSAQDTLGASYVLANYDDYTLTGNEVEVVVPSLTSIEVNTVG